MSLGFSAQFFSSLADNALLVAAIALVGLDAAAYSPAKYGILTEYPNLK